ncbi:RNB domain-containing ribonuclease [bacterium]|nr:RNB domain-containing ribonuclease [Actinomycetota bacterium]NDG29246.1 RNB domain-containing ribonuclease [bacterium]
MKVAGVLDVLSKTKYGMTSRGVPMYLLTPINQDLPQLICGCSIKNPKKNILVVAEKVNDDKIPRGNILHYLGDCGILEAELRAIEYAYTPNYWPSSLPKVTLPSMNRKILDVDTVNIDPVGCQDIDDCISFWDYHVAITIADVGEWIQCNPWMKEALHIGQTLYREGNSVRKLFPHEHAMSLVPDEKRLGIALIFEFIDNTIMNSRFEEIVIINKKSYTYESCKEWKYSNKLQRLASHLAKRESNDPHEWIEQLMIYYNKMFAACLSDMGMGLLRGHSAPDMEKVEHYRKIGLPEYLGYSSAQYYPISAGSLHWSMSGIYCHASSPIRRFADCINQLAYKCIDFVDDCSTELNRLQKYSKKFKRDVTFASLMNEGKKLTGVIVSSRRIWCPELSCMITCENSGYASQEVNLEYFYDPNKVTWKKRVIFTVSGKSCTSSLLQGQ